LWAADWGAGGLVEEVGLEKLDVAREGLVGLGLVEAGVHEDHVGGEGGEDEVSGGGRWLGWDVGGRLDLDGVVDGAAVGGDFVGEEGLGREEVNGLLERVSSYLQKG